MKNMTQAEIIDGKTIAKKMREEVAQQATTLSLQPGLGVIMVGDNKASERYVRNKTKACSMAGFNNFEKLLPADAKQETVADIIQTFNDNSLVHGILLQLPLPGDDLNSDALIQMIDPKKDVDGLTFENIGKLVVGDESGLVPCTPQGSMALIKSVEKNLSGKFAVVVGRSLLFGKPMAQLLEHENCTVVKTNRETRNLPELCGEADIIVAAAGQAKMIKGDWLKTGAVVIDGGINPQEDGKLFGDVDYDEALEVAGAITPVPGGVGPMTIACLIKNTLKAAKLQHNLD